MNSTVMVRRDVKNKAAKRAKAQGFALTTVVKILLDDYAEGRINIGSFSTNLNPFFSVDTVVVDSETQTMLDQAAEEMRNHLPS